MTNFTYDPETGMTVSEIKIGSASYIGTAHCHPEDRDMISEFTGGEIADRRALIKAFKDQRANLKSELADIEHIFGCMEQNKRYNPHCYEARMFRRFKMRLVAAIDNLSQDIADQEDELAFYLKEREARNQKIKARKG